MATPPSPLDQSSLTLPKGGGAIRGIGEKFAANPVTGTGSMTVPIACSPGRSGFGPQLTLSYDSGAGNGPFGFGWQLSVASISRKTDKGLPRYDDAAASDVFLLSGAEDLVPALEQRPTGWVTPDPVRRTMNGTAYLVRRYLPRIEGSFARIERWTSVTDAADTCWRSISSGNVTTWYGRTAESRIADPDDPTRIFRWLICETYDQAGNVVRHRYAAEDDAGVDHSAAHERNRTTRSRSAGRHLKRILYGNRRPYRPDPVAATPVPLPTDWCFEVVLDYGDHDLAAPLPDEPAKRWACRSDPFSSYRAGFEVRTYRRCRRALMFHHFPADPAVGPNCLVRSTDLTYSPDVDPTDPANPIYSFLVAVTQRGHVRQGAGYLTRSLPPLELTYSKPVIDPTVRELDDRDSLGNLPEGIDGTRHRFVDLDGDGAAGVLTEQAGAWFYKPNLSPGSPPRGGTSPSPGAPPVARFGPTEVVASLPSPVPAGVGNTQAQLLDLDGDGQLDLVTFDPSGGGFFERSPDSGWEPFRPFPSLPVLDWSDPRLTFVELTGDGLADLLLTEDQAIRWHPSLGEDGFGPAERVAQALDEERGPRVAVADGTRSVLLGDLSGDGLADLVRVRNGEVCYWPNLGHGRFGAKVTMDDAPWFEPTDLFDARRVRLADIDGSGTADLVYLGTDGVQLHLNRSGNSWGAGHTFGPFPDTDPATHVTVVDLLGNGTACLVWSSPLPGDTTRPLRYVDLMGGTKPHLLTGAVNNLGLETRVRYAPSTKFAVDDRLAGRPWATKLPFPVQVVERVETYDHVSRNRFGTRYAYHHGCYDGVDREFRGFGMVEQWDTEQLASFRDDGTLPPAANLDADSHVPPVLTRTWFHTGSYLGRDRISHHFADEYWREPGLSDADAAKRLLDDTVLEPGWSVDDEREACRALKGSMLRQEVFALDGSPAERHPYTVTEQNFHVVRLQPAAGNRHGVHLPTVRESLSSSCERNPSDPRVGHDLTLEVDRYGNARRSLSIAFGRRAGATSLTGTDAAVQATALVTYTEHDLTNAVDEPDAFRTPLPSATRSYEITGFPLGDDLARPAFAAWTTGPFALPASTVEIPYEQAPNPALRQRRLIDEQRTRYRSDDLKTLLSQGVAQPLAIGGQSWTLAFTPGLLTEVYRRTPAGGPAEDLLPDRATVVFTAGGDRGGYVDLDGDGRAWAPSGRTFFWTGADAANPTLTAVQELAEARAHFFLTRKSVDPFGQSATTDFDADDLLVTRTIDAVGNTGSAVHDHRVLQPSRVVDANGNASEAAYDALGQVVATAVRGKAGDATGDSVAGITADLPTPAITGFFDAADPRPLAPTLLGNATTRIVHDVDRFRRTRAAAPTDPTKWEPAGAASIARESHVNAPPPPGGTRVQVGFGWSDGAGREIQRKARAEPGPVVAGGPVVGPRWVGSGWTIVNNKGLPVRQYEPYFSATHRFEFAHLVGVSPVLFYDPLGRAVATLRPDATYEKVRFDPWSQATYDVTDTSASDPRTDPDIAGYVGPWFALHPVFSTWAAQRLGGGKGPHEKVAAEKTVLHADTPLVAHGDPLGRPFLSIGHNRFVRAGAVVDESYAGRVTLDIEGNRRLVRDAVTTGGNPLGRVAARYRYDLRGNCVHQASIDAGERWALSDITGNPIRAWNSRRYRFASAYDGLRRPVRSTVSGGDPAEPGARLFPTPLTFERTVYGESPETALTLAQQQTANLRGRVVRRFDGSGSATSDRYDVSGNLLGTTRRFAQDYTAPPDWGGAPALEAESFTTATTFDALGRATSSTSADGSTHRPTYDEAGMLDQVHVNLRGAQAGGAPVWTPFVTAIDHDQQGRRTRIEYQNGAVTTYGYDPLTFRLVHLRTTRPAGLNGLGAQLFSAPTVVQDLRYTYDAAGSIVRITDDALPTIFHGGGPVEPVGTFTYDALARLVESTGREHIGQSAFQPDTTGSLRDHPFVGAAHLNDGQAVRTYTERFAYDPVGNLDEVAHTATGGGWSRTYQYAATDNRLVGTTVTPGSVESYQHDAHGNMTRMPHLPVMRWDELDRLAATSRQVVNDVPPPATTPETTHYVYDAAGQRVRKVSERTAGNRRSERLYVGGIEIYREYGPGGVRTERETLHVMDDQRRIALVETKTRDDGQAVPSPAPALRYQLGNHLDSAALELDGQGAVLTYEEYSAYGTTTYQAGRNAAEVGLKRYRYTGRERDEESGFSHHDARYYAPWLARWTACDPVDKHPRSSYEYCGGRPTVFSDPSGRDEDPVRGVSFAGSGGASDVSRSYEPPKPPKQGGMTAGYSPAPKAPPSSVPPETVSSSAKTPAPPTYWEQRIADMYAKDKMQSAGQGYFNYQDEITKEDRRDAANAKAHPYFANRIAARQREEFFMKAAPFLLPGGPEVRAATIETKGAAALEAGLATRAAETLAPKILTAEEELAGPLIEATTPSTPHTVTTTDAQLQSFANAADQPVVWIAGDEVLAGGHRQVMATNPTTWYALPGETANGVVGYRNAIGELPLPTPTGPAPMMYGVEIHHFSYPRSAFPTQVMDAENLFIMYPRTHTQIHNAFGGTQSMGWGGIQGAETPVRNMFNFWVKSPR